MKYVMSIDQGTTSSRCILFDRKGTVCASAQKEFRQIYPEAGWVEHDALEIWDTVLSVAREAMNKLGVSASDIVAIGITNQRETTVIWDKLTGVPITNAIVWQCRRTSNIVDGLVSAGYTGLIREKTGLVPDAYFSGSKIRWILDNVPGAEEKAQKGELLFGTIDTWLIWKFTGGRVHVTDQTNASRTMLFNIHTLNWDEDLLKVLGIPSSMLPEVRPSSSIYGLTDSEFFGGEIPVAGAAGDQQCALFGQCCFSPGEMKNTYGTGCFLLMNTGSVPVKSSSGLITTVAAGFGDHVEYALEGSVFVSGAAIQWLRDELHIIEEAAESEEIAQSVPDCAGGYVVPAFTGLGAPYWNQRARGVIVGLTRGFNRAHLVRAVLESMAYQAYDICKAMEKDSQTVVRNLRVDGGASVNDFLMQFQSDILQCEVLRPACIETTALGAAYLAGLAVGYWTDKADILANRQVDRIFKPSMAEGKSETLIKGWHRAVKCACLWGNEN